MSEGLNLVTLFGNLGADPELKITDKGAVLKLRLATSRTWLDKEEKKNEETEWHNLTMFGRRAEGVHKHLQKGSKIAIKGRLKTSSWEKDGQKRSRTEVIIEDLYFGGGKPNGAFIPAQAMPASVGPADLPF
jgi:single-strand DNA-binding protein